MASHDRGKQLSAGYRRGAIAGLCATLVGIGLARFAYTPLMPALIEAGWFGPGSAAYLGAANLLGYLLGAATAHLLLRRAPIRATLRIVMGLAALTFFACSLRWGFAWFLFWRFLSGWCGAVIMVGTAPFVLTVVPAERRGLVGGLVFTGVGVGIALSGSLVPQLVALHIVAAWLGLGVLSLILTAIAWTNWPPGTKPAGGSAMFSLRNVSAVLPVIGIYAVAAVGLVPHMVFLVDYIARGLGQGLAAGSLYWVIFGIGAACGPLTTGRAADRIGFSAAIRIGLALQLAAVLLPVLFPVAPSLALSAFVMGAFTPGMAPLVLGRMAELTPGQDQRGAWTLATLGFALAQAGGAWLLSAVFDRTEAYEILFGIGGGAIALALLLSLLHRQPVPLAQQSPPAK